jgi:tellurite resistance protein TerC
MPHIFPFSEFWPFYIVFSVGVLAVLWASLKTFHRKAHEISVREASISALSWMCLALLFNVILYFFTLHRLGSVPDVVATFGAEPSVLAQRTALEFLSGYLVEKALAVDNLFVFIVIFRFFSIPPHFQHRVLFYGLFGALALRAVFIAMGAAIMDIHWVVIGFGLFLMYQGIEVLRGKEPEIHPEKNRMLRFLNRYLPISQRLEGERFFIRDAGKWMVTPLFIALIFIEITDIMFAFDSVPAIFGLTKEPLIVFTSNIFAVIDLRALYFLLAAFISRFHYLSVGLSLVLIFIGSKMAILDGFLSYNLPTEVSLLVVLGLIGGSILLSLVKPPTKVQEQIEPVAKAE